MTDDELLEAFDRCTLTAESFGHREHVRLAWLHVTRLPLLEAIRQHTLGLRRLTEALGAVGKYHATITIAFLLLIHERAAASRTADSEAFLREHPDFIDAGLEIIERHYETGVLGDDGARRQFVLPNRVAATGAPSR